MQKENILVPFDDCEFQEGEIVFSLSFSWHSKPILFSIANGWLRKEYEYIKEYFSRFIGQKGSFRALVEVTLTHGNIKEAKASSEDISRIDSTIIDKVKYQRVVNLLKTPVNKEGKSLFTTDDIFQNFENKVGNIFEQNAQEILNQIIQFKKVRNEKQLEWLSKEIQPIDYKLRFTLTPLFGFVFFLPGRKQDFFCWELLETNATYLWSFIRNGSAIDELYDIVEVEIKTIEEVGREQYRRNQKHNKDSKFSFIALDHRSNSQADDHFSNWKKKIEYLLIGNNDKQ